MGIELGGHLCDGGVIGLERFDLAGELGRPRERGRRLLPFAAHAEVRAHEKSVDRVGGPRRPVADDSHGMSGIAKKVPDRRRAHVRALRLDDFGFRLMEAMDEIEPSVNGVERDDDLAGAIEDRERRDGSRERALVFRRPVIRRTTLALEGERETVLRGTQSVMRDRERFVFPVRGELYATEGLSVHRELDVLGPVRRVVAKAHLQRVGRRAGNFGEPDFGKRRPVILPSPGERSSG